MINSVDLDTATRFVEAFKGKTTPFLQTFNDRAKDGTLIKSYRGWSPYVQQNLVRLNTQKTAGVFMCINDVPEGSSRKGEFISGINALFIDVDGTRELAKGFPIEPSIICQRSESLFHAHWLLEADQPLDKFTEAQNKLISYYGSDKAVKDLPRIMRVPGFYNHKGDPQMFSMIKCDPNLRYTIKEVMAGHPVKEDIAPRPFRAGPMLTFKGGDALRYMNWAAKISTEKGARHKKAMHISLTGKERDMTLDAITRATLCFATRVELPEQETLDLINYVWTTKKPNTNAYQRN